MWKHMKLDPATMENLPDEILSDIFIQLSAKQFAQMRSVCKPWNVLLSKPSFVKSHLQHSTHNNNDAVLLFFHQQRYFHDNSITARLTRSPNLDLTNFINVPNNHRLDAIGSVDGLICFCCGSYPSYDICIWNPSLSVVLTLPPSSSPSDFSNNCLQFGFDPKTDDYKVVKLTSFFMANVEVYSMRKNSWKKIFQWFSSHVRHDQNKFSVHGHDGHIHWLCDTVMRSKERQTIVGFDLGEETFCEIPLPDSILDHNSNRTNVLGVLKEKLCVMSCVKHGEFEVWEMDKSWVKRHTFDQLTGDNIIPYGFTSRGELLFKAGKYAYDFSLY